MKVMDFGDLVKIVGREDARRRDLECRASELKVNVRAVKGKGNEFVLLAKPKEKGFPGGGRRPVELPFTYWGLKSLIAARLKLPFPFITRDAPPAITQEILDHFLQKSSGRAFRVRLRKGEEGWKVLGVLPSTYPRFTNSDMLDAAGYLAREAEMKSLRYRIDDEGLFAHLVFPNAFDVKGNGKPDRHRFGIWIRHSDVGCCSPSVEFTVVRQICSNGMVGLTGEPLVNLSRSALYNLSSVKVGDRIRYRAESALKVRHRFMDVLAQSRGAPAKESNARQEMLRVLKDYRIPPRYLDVLAHSYRQEGGNSPEAGADRWSVAQAFTRAAQGMEPDLQERFERVAWSYLSEKE